jgi:aspartyl-tRNA(Asn)/glutamyl-tRNA(Gln) amidotransferase subunit B
MKDYEIIVGLEVHAELKTESKIYCSCKNAFGLEVNTQICPICLGMPGTLPTLNEKVVEYAVKMGYATNCKINPISKQDRKNYFYPDLPKAYQISQADIPICEDGYLDIMVNGEEKRIGIVRIHIEEDAGKLLHDDAFDGSLCDFNRCGVPLIEIVSKPDLRSSEEAKAYLETIRLILQYLDISDGKMQEGSIRCDVNVSVRKKGETKLNTRCEMKNVNSFSAAMHAIDYEAARQIQILEQGGTITQETRRWDESKGMSFPMRSKEDAHDYRYFPEPDLLTIVIPDSKLQKIKDSIPELPNVKMRRFISDFGLTQIEATLIIENLEKCRIFDECIAIGGCSPKNVANWVLSDVSKFMNDSGKTLSETKMTSEKLCDIIRNVENGKISNASGKIIFEKLLSEEKTVEEMITELGLSQVSDESEIQKIVITVLSQNEKSVMDYKNGKTNALGYLVGQCMKLSQGKANPTMCRELVLKTLSES